MHLLTDAQARQLLANGTETQQALERVSDPPDHLPVVKLFTPDAACTWLLTEIDPEETDIAFGLCDLGMGFPEIGSVSLAELRQLRGRLGLPVERDLSFRATHPLSVYAAAARSAQGITTDAERLERAARKEGL